MSNHPEMFKTKTKTETNTKTETETDHDAWHLVFDTLTRTLPRPGRHCSKAMKRASRLLRYFDSGKASVVDVESTREQQIAAATYAVLERLGTGTACVGPHRARVLYALMSLTTANAVRIMRAAYRHKARAKGKADRWGDDDENCLVVD